MSAFQLDECFSANAFRVACNRDGPAIVRRYPKKHKGLKDPEMLAIYMKKDGALLTTDHTIIDEHKEHIPNENPGIVIVAHSEKNPRRITLASARAILGEFKKKFPEWHSVPWHKTMIKITDASIDVGHIENGNATFDFARSMEEDDWQDALKGHLARNTSRKIGISND